MTVRFIENAPILLLLAITFDAIQLGWTNPGDVRVPIVRYRLYRGAGATILPGVHIGKRALIGAGAIVTHDVPDDVVVKCEPARVHVKSVSA